ncbi:folic acid synthesis protein [Beauveria brongniartii RCEF 3172]|uniref:2-amino-4-hydroxy-6-hydroxymethyldihydropteridine diphosphokinase n=1 Tax=Beauveria brongniartii RCEF 3172 TaxID=1081107 RepID=A0A167C4U8_9HYPO|nr:folic acid synthesis protein [Beauveria brongniartii RCEF 3172]
MTSITHSRFASRALPRAGWPSACRGPRAGALRAITSRAAALPSTAACSRRATLKSPLLEASRSSSSSRSRRSYAAGCGCRGGKRTTTAYIALGGNLGDRVAEIERACNEMDRRGIKVTRTSSLWETEPMYVTDQDRFLNGVCEVETELQPMALLDELQSIERDLGRRKLIDKGPRNIDLDILLYGDERISNERLTVPHIGIPEREFVLRPLSELIPSKSIDPSKPWKLVQDYLNDLAAVGEPLSSVTRISASAAPLTPLTPNRASRIMAILNLTPDSFSDGGRHAAAATADLSATILDMVRGGATIIDVGGQSTAPGRPEFVGRVTAVEDPAARTWGTAAAVAAAVQGGADVLRVHDVEQMAAVAAMSDAIWRP